MLRKHVREQTGRDSRATERQAVTQLGQRQTGLVVPPQRPWSRSRARKRSKPRHGRRPATLGQLYAGRDNGIGVIRLGLAVVVVLTHGTSLGFGWEDLGESLFRGQTNTGTLAVFGFFVLSGLLITRSAARTSLGRFIWHRMLRSCPGCGCACW